ncbi:MAG: HAMP domain-containing protein [Planctomycetota bacterium]
MKVKRRKKDFVDPEVQGALARRLIAHWALFLLAACGLSLVVKWMFDPFAPISETLAEVWYTYAPVLAVLACLAPVFIYDSIRLSNRFTGPVFRLKQATRQLAEGDLPERVEFRGADFWKDLAADFNVIANRLREQDAKTGAAAESV